MIRSARTHSRVLGPDGRPFRLTAVPPAYEGASVGRRYNVRALEAGGGVWTPGGSEYHGDLGTLPPGEAINWTLVVQPQSTGTVVGTVQAGTTSFEPQVANNRSSVTTRVAQTGGDLFWSRSFQAVDEDRSQVTLTVCRTGGVVGAVSVDYETVDGTAVAGSDYVAAMGTVVFEDGQSEKTVEVTVMGDFDIEASETFSLNLTVRTSEWLGAVIAGQTTTRSA